jgi:hypothetical protein
MIKRKLYIFLIIISFSISSAQKFFTDKDEKFIKFFIALDVEIEHKNKIFTNIYKEIKNWKETSDYAQTTHSFKLIIKYYIAIIELIENNQKLTIENIVNKMSKHADKKKHILELIKNNFETFRMYHKPIQELIYWKKKFIKKFYTMISGYINHNTKTETHKKIFLFLQKSYIEKLKILLKQEKMV